MFQWKIFKQAIMNLFSPSMGAHWSITAVLVMMKKQEKMKRGNVFSAITVLLAPRGVFHLDLLRNPKCSIAAVLIQWLSG